MSLKRNCDICGKVIGASEEKDYPDCAIYLGDTEEPTYEFEDLCEDCSSKMKAVLLLIMDGKEVEEKKEQQAQSAQIISVGSVPLPMPVRLTADYPEPSISIETPAETVPQQITEDAPRPVANGITKQYKTTKRERTVDPHLPTP